MKSLKCQEDAKDWEFQHTRQRVEGTQKRDEHLLTPSQAAQPHVTTPAPGKVSSAAFSPIKLNC